MLLRCEEIHCLPFDVGQAKFAPDRELVLSTCWYTNVRTHVPKAVWDRLRRQVAAEAGDRCEICGERGRR